MAKSQEKGLVTLFRKEKGGDWPCELKVKKKKGGQDNVGGNSQLGLTFPGGAIATGRRSVIMHAKGVGLT